MDVPWCVRRALSSVRTERFVLAETELWPIFLRELLKRGIPCHIVNGRISDYTLRRYQMTRSLFAPLLERISTVCVASETQADRYRELGVRPEIIHVTGHTKYDSAPKVNDTLPRGQLRNELFPGIDDATPVVTLGSVHPGEESVWLDAAQAIRREGKPVKLVLAPRHMERVSYFIDALQKTDLSWARWSERQARAEYDVLLLDVMGRLEEGYAIASLAFIGATLVDIGGHNPLEAAMYGVPLVVGPYTSVISDVLDDMRAVNALTEIHVGESVRGLLERVVNGDPALREAGERGQRVWSHHRGAAHRVVSVIEHG
jgi:3-deoxy-D-manno-octulosonic-acid transferase